MAILRRISPVIILLVFLSLTAACPASVGKAGPVAQVYELQGQAEVKSGSDGRVAEVKKGCLLGQDDYLILESNASLALYFKNGGRKEIRARDSQVTYKVGDLLPKAQAYDQNVTMFGATRGIDAPEAASQTPGFFFPQEAVILDSPPLIEFALFNGPQEKVALSGATIRVLKNAAVLDSRNFSNLEYGSVYSYRLPKVDDQAEYIVELKLGLRKTPGNIMSVSFPLYISGTSDKAPGSKYSSFSDPVYRSFESAYIDYNGKRRAVTLIKQLSGRSSSSQPVVELELFIP